MKVNLEPLPHHGPHTKKVCQGVISFALFVVLFIVLGYIKYWYFDPYSPFAPRRVECPSSPIVRQIKGQQTLAVQESDWVAGRETEVRDAWRAYLQRVGLKDFDVEAFLAANERLPRIGLAMSGGGNRAMLVGAGVISSLDERNPEAVSSKTGGILQMSTYVSALSGGSFLVGSMFTTNFPTVSWLFDNVWKIDVDVATPASIDAISDIGIYAEFIKDVADKTRAGFKTSITDYWSRLVAVHTTNHSNYGVSQTFSGLADSSSFKNHQTPFPIVVWDQRRYYDNDVSEYSNIWETSFFETGSFSPAVNSFIDTTYLGTSMDNGKPVSNKQCVVGFDHFAFHLGISSSIFNQALNDINKASNGSFLSQVITYLSDANVDSALVPNPFYKLAGVENETSSIQEVELVDGGEDGQNVPLWPLIQPAREIDVVFAVDSTVSYYEGGWPNGSSIISTAEYAKRSNIPFPPVPLHAEEYQDQGLIDRTTFFGCYLNEADKPKTGSLPPLLVYVPNRFGTFPSNASTFKRAYERDLAKSYIGNGFSLLADKETQGTVASEVDDWSACLACALIHRAGNSQPTEQCQSCLKAACWEPSNPPAPVAQDRLKHVSDFAPERQTKTPAADQPAEDKPKSHSALPSFWATVLLITVFVITITAFKYGLWMRSGSVEDRQPLLRRS
ncbi:lysophospholipase catalytic domain-containing protein [Polychytrium aggregatum]|uniref:lysophospholipase catalytic domain-containing protein n=1 Tax=Polychytrium aggregatum TaxID=110093 RepID=UPI0022FDC077|nr:lysophospholipase catalytic domain-containing protein [Polychytrium aggregatum]KAI9205197.1 lysophospholipase catalytic domain-containing protein [Polychytrium aggregatum]